MAVNKPINSVLPRQMVPWKIKYEEKKDSHGITEWQKDCIDALESIGRYSFYNNLELSKNYQIMEGRFNMHDYIDAFDSYDISSIVYEQMKLPSYLKHYDITSKAVKLLLGEYIKRPDICRVVAKDDDSTNEILRTKTDLLHLYIQQEIQQEITKKMLSQGINPNKSDFKTEEEAQQYKEDIQKKYQEMTPESIEKYMRYDYRTAGEEWGQAVLINDVRRFNMKELDVLEFYDMCVADRCFGHFYLTPEGYNYEKWNTLNTFYQYSPELRYIEEGNYIGRVIYLSKPQVIDLFGWRMDIRQIESLYPEFQKEARGGSVYTEMFNATLYPFSDYREYETISTAIGSAYEYGQFNGNSASFPFIGFYPGLNGNSVLFSQSDLVQVTQVYWKSQRKIGKLNLVNPDTGQVEVTIVDEMFDPKLFGVEVIDEIYRDSNDPNTICWTWITESWQGVKINVNYEKEQINRDDGVNSAIYVDVRPCPFQFRGNDPKLMHKCKLPVIGQIFNNINGRSQSVVDLLKPYQILVNAFYNQAFQVVQKNNGKFFLMGASLLPSIKDWGGEDSMENFMTMCSNIGLGVIDDSLSNTQSGISMQYGLKVMDMDESERITRLINLAMLTEQQGFMQLGITPQRQGQIAATQTATGSTQSINNSYAITEIYFENFSNYRRRKLQMMVEMAQFVASREEDITLPYITSDGGKAFITTTGTDLLLRNLGIYMENSAEMQKKKDLIEELILKNNQSLMPLSKLVEIIKSDNLADIQKSLEVAENEQQKQLQAQQEAEQKQVQDQIKAQADEADKQREFTANENQLNRESKERIEVLKGIANESSYSQDENLVPDLIEQGKLGLQQSQHEFDKSIKTQELVQKNADALRQHSIKKEELGLKRKDLELKQKDIQAKKDLENKKLGVEQSKMKNDLEIAKIKKPIIKPKLKK